MTLITSPIACPSYCNNVAAFTSNIASVQRKRINSSVFSSSSDSPSTNEMTTQPPLSPSITASLKNNDHQSIHLLSLKWSALNTSPTTITHNEDMTQPTRIIPKQQLPFSKLVRDTWKWKDSVLGDGRDFFVPKPKTLQALNQAFIDTSKAVRSSITIQECSIISNCARFELILVCNNNNNNNSHHSNGNKNDSCSDQNKHQIRQIVSQTILQQLDYHNKQGTSHMFWKNQLSRFDWPDQIYTSTAHPLQGRNNKNEQDDSKIQELQQYWVHLNDPQQIVNHLSIMAAGIAKRPNRPDREVPFRPFSSRDAHILLQLKRTSEIASPTTKLLLDTALSAGKAARNPQIVPQLSKLKSYGTGNTKYSVEPPQDLLQSVTQEAIQLGIDPIVQSCMDKLFTISVSDQITNLRTTCLELASTAEEESIVKKLLHEPTVQLRQNNGKNTNQQDIVDQIQLQLLQLRKEKEEQRQ